MRYLVVGIFIVTTFAQEVHAASECLISTNYFGVKIKPEEAANWATTEYESGTVLSWKLGGSDCEFVFRITDQSQNQRGNQTNSSGSIADIYAELLSALEESRIVPQPLEIEETTSGLKVSAQVVSGGSLPDAYFSETQLSASGVVEGSCSGDRKPVLNAIRAILEPNGQEEVCPK